MFFPLDIVGARKYNECQYTDYNDLSEERILPLMRNNSSRFVLPMMALLGAAAVLTFLIF